MFNNFLETLRRYAYCSFMVVFLACVLALVTAGSSWLLSYICAPEFIPTLSSAIGFIVAPVFLFLLTEKR